MTSRIDPLDALYSPSASIKIVQVAKKYDQPEVRLRSSRSHFVESTLRYRGSLSSTSRNTPSQAVRTATSARQVSPLSRPQLLTARRQELDPGFLRRTDLDARGASTAVTGVNSSRLYRERSRSARSKVAGFVPPSRPPSAESRSRVPFPALFRLVSCCGA